MKMDCHLIKDLLPSYVEELVSEDTRTYVDQHLAECGECREEFRRMSEEMHLEVETPKIDKRSAGYLLKIRMWYLLCPIVALLLRTFGLVQPLYLYEGFLLLMTAVFVSSQFFGSFSHRGYDIEQGELALEAEKRTRRQWGPYYISPISWCIPNLLVLSVAVVHWLMTVYL